MYNGIVPRSWLYNVETRLPNEVFAVELLSKPVIIKKDEHGYINVIINRNGVKDAIISTEAKRKICETYVEGNESKLLELDRNVHNFLIGRSEIDSIEIPLDEFPLRWASGGVLSIVRLNKHGKNKWSPFFFRDIKPYGWNIPLGSSERHFFNNKLN